MISPRFRKVALRFLEGVGSPSCLTAASLVRNGDYLGLVNLKTDPRRYSDHRAYRSDVLGTELLRKFAGLPTGIDLKKAAIDGFYAAEKQCCRTNMRLRPFLDGSYDPLDEQVMGFFRKVRRLTASVLGEIPDALTGQRFGPGATYDDRGRLTTVPDKIASKPTLTSGCAHLVPLWGLTAWARSYYERKYRPTLKFVRGGRFTTVPKDSSKDRGIDIQPSFNLYFQLGVGSHIRRRLKGVGIDLDHGQSTHRLLACDASLSGSKSTIDLRSASDCLANTLVLLCLPRGWSELLQDLRSPVTEVEGKTVILEKFSAMGNGFTFELETLIFWALLRTALDQTGQRSAEVYVYGDDIIVDSRFSSLALKVLSYAGFTPNQEKTFVEGPFRESCGGDFFDGVATRPLYIKEEPIEPQDWISLANGIRKVALQTYGLWDNYNPLFGAWLSCLDQIPSAIRSCRGPVSLGDIVIHDDPERWVLRRRSNGIRWLRCYRPVAKGLPWHHWDDSVRFAAALYGVPSSGPRERNVSGYKLGWVSYS